MKLVIIHGGTSTGKTTLARRLAKDLEIPAFLKDDFKEREFDQLGKIPNLLQWYKIEQASWRAMYAAVKKAITRRDSLIIEGNFMKRQRQVLKQIIPAGTKVFEIYCHASGDTPLRRYKERLVANRHKGHRDKIWVPIVWSQVKLSSAGLRAHKPMDISPNLKIVNTSDFSKVNYPEILDFIKGDKK